MSARIPRWAFGGPIDTVEDVAVNSFKDFHAKGLDYLCLHRSAELTRKLYIFRGDVSRAPEVVNPHNHRYNFLTRVVHGHVANSLYRPSQHGEVQQRFAYRTPLLGGSGFEWEGEERLHEYRRDFYVQHSSWRSYAHEVHTLRILRDCTVLLLDQYADLLAEDQPTHTWTSDREPPSLDGLYSKFTVDELLDRLKLVGAL